LNEKAVITHANKATLAFFNLEPTDIVGLRIEQFILFGNQSLVKHLKMISSAQKKWDSPEAVFETSVNQGNIVSKGFTVSFRPAGEDCVMVLSRSQEMVDLAEKIEATKTQIDDIITRIFPHDTRPFFKAATTAAVSSKRCMIVGLRLLTDWEGLTQNSELCTTTIGNFRKCAYKASSGNEDCVIFKVVGMSLFAAFNVKAQEQMMSGVFKCAKKFLVDCFSGFEEKGLSCCASLVYSKQIVFGRLSTLSANFNGYAVEIRDSCRCLDIETPGTIAICTNCLDKLSPLARALVRKDSECSLYGAEGLLHIAELISHGDQ
jgi:hypothetical protein